MKKNKGNEFEHTSISWEEFEKEMSASRKEQGGKDKFEWDRPLVDETWDDPVTGEIPPIREATESEAKALKGITALLPSEDAIYKATLDEDLDLSAEISKKLEKVAESEPVDEQAIRLSVDRKIVHQSEELKGKRQTAEEGKKRKVRRRIPKDPEKAKELRGSRETAEALKNERVPVADHKERKRKSAYQDEQETSSFRERSMNWRDGRNGGEVPVTSAPDGGTDDLDGAMPSFFLRLKKVTALEWVSVILALIIVVTAAMTSAVYADYRGEQNRALALASLKKYEQSEPAGAMETVVEEEETASVGAQDEIVEVKTLSLVLSSVEKDLKIKLVDQDDTLVKDVPWGVLVTDEDGRVSDNDDDDEDGIIYLTDIGAGDYSVELKPNDALSGYILPKSAQTVSVNAKIEYKVIANIKDEIKSEKEVNAAVEDNGNKAADVETATVSDTVEWVESTKTANGETYVESEVALENTGIGKAALGFKKNLIAALKSLGAHAKETYNLVLGSPLYVASADPQSEEGTTPTETVGNSESGTETEPTPEPTPDPTPEPSPQKNPQISSVSVSNGSLKVGESATLSCEGSDLDGLTIVYSASNDCVSISGNTVTAKKAGSVSITAKVQGYDGTDFTVNDMISVAEKEKEKVPVSKIEVKAASSTIAVGKTTTVSATVSPSNATDKTVTWASENTAVATVDAAGKVTGVAAGSVKIVASAADGSGVSGSATITVSNDAVAVTKLTMKPTECSVAVKGNYQLAVAVEPTNATDKTVTWASENAKIATVSDGGLVTGVKEGTVKITATAHDGSKKTAVCLVTVTKEQAYDPDAQLYDKDKNPLYKLVDGKYVLAKYKDYQADKSLKVFKKTEGFLYTGWQTIDGKTYYYKKDNTYVTGDQIIGGVTYHFATDGSLTKGSGTLGIDVSKYQPSINWTSVKNSGVSFVIIRCGYRGSSTGVLIQDPYFTSHIKGAKAAGLKVGVYFFTTALTEAEAIEEASMCAYLCSGYGINYPVFMDCESSNRPGYNSLGAAQRTQIIQAFCNTLKSAGYTPGVYANKTWLTEKMNASSLSGYKIWLAQYNPTGPTYNGRYDLWQYTSKGSVSGISGNVDMNQSYLGY